MRRKKTMYRSYKSDNAYKSFLKGGSENRKITQKLYNKVVNLIYDRLREELLVNGESIELPYLLGWIAIEGKKIKTKINPDGTITGAPVNWYRTLKLWESNEKEKKAKTLCRDYYLETDMYFYKLRWNKVKSSLKMLKNYDLTAVPNFKKSMKDNLKKGQTYRNI